MATITPAPFSLNGLVLAFGADDYSLVISSAEFVPTTANYNWKNIRGTVYSFPGSTTWVLNIGAIQDHKSSASFTAFCNANIGIAKDVTLTPQAGGKAYKATVTIEATNIGGAVDTVGVSTVSFQVQGAPAVVTA